MNIGARISVERVNTDLLAPVTVRPPLGTYILQLWKRRHFIIADSRARVASGGRQMMLGQLWLVLKPLLDASVYLVIFGLVLQTSRGIDKFLGYLIIGVFLFQFTTRCMSQGATAITGGRALIHAFRFPRAALPTAVVVRETISMLPVLGTMFVLLLTVPLFEAEVTWRWLLFPLVFALQLLFNFGISLIVARAVSQVRDLTHLITLISRAWFYSSGVFFSIDRFASAPEVITTVMTINPLYLVLAISRDVLLYGKTPEPAAWALLAGWTALSLVVGLIYFWRGEERYGRD